MGLAARAEVRLGIVGEGAQGVVWRVLRADGVLCAVKIPHDDAPSREALIREHARLTALTGVPGVVPVWEPLDPDAPRLVMPAYVETFGEWLERAVASPGPDTLPDLLEKLAAVARALAAVHRVTADEGVVVHRDVKPDNIYLDAQGRPFLGDFGLAVVSDPNRLVELTCAGTPWWAPLDQLLPGRVGPDPTWDTYALCGILFTAIAGERPAWQADPRPLLTPLGDELWGLVVEAAGADAAAERERALCRFALRRVGRVAAEIVDCTGRAALAPDDLAKVAAGLRRLAPWLPEPLAFQRRLANLLLRGLSPVAAPSPPNRFHDAQELADELDALAAAVGRAQRRPTLVPLALSEPEEGDRLMSLLHGAMEVVEPALDPVDELEATPRRLVGGAPVLAVAMGLLALAMVVFLWSYRDAAVAVWAEAFAHRAS